MSFSGCYFCCMPYLGYQTRKIAKYYENEYKNNEDVGCFYSVLPFFFHSIPLCFLMDKHGIFGSCFGDCCCALFCPVCAVGLLKISVAKSEDQILRRKRLQDAAIW